MSPTGPIDRAGLARCLFAPRSVALVGASDDARKNTGRPLRFLRKHGYTGRVFPVNPGRAQVMGEAAFARVDAIPEAVDHALVMVPAAAVESALVDCARHGVPLVTVFSDGFAEQGAQGEARQRRLLGIAREAGIRLLGPNSIGVIGMHARVALTVNAALEGALGAPGGCAFVSQSGSMLGTVISRGAARGTGFSQLVSVGNEADLGVAEIVDLLVDDPHTDTILLFLESIRDAAGFARAAQAASRAGKPLIAYKLGRSAVGEALAVSHTGALAGSDAAADALLRAYGVVRVDMIETLLEIAPLVRGAPRRVSFAPRTSGTAVATTRPMRVAALSTTGGGAAMVADRLGTLGLDVVAPDDALVARLAADGVAIRPAPVVDLTLAVTSRAYRAVLDGMLGADFCDAVLAVVGSSAQFQPELAVRPIVEAHAAARAAGNDKPLAVFLAPHAEASLAVLAQAGIAAFRTPEACADALAALSRARVPRASVSRGLERTIPSGARRTLDEADSLACFDALGIATVPRALLEAPPWRHALPYPVAAKLVCADLPHKTEAGAVTLRIGDDAALAAAIERMRTRLAVDRPGLRVRGVLVQAMLPAIAEVLVGYRVDAGAGPLVVLGAGGQMAEALGDVAVRLAPASLDDAHEMIAEVRALAPARGFRGLPRGDLDALARAIVALGSLADGTHGDIVEAEINPMMVSVHGAIAVDGLVVRTDSRE